MKVALGALHILLIRITTMRQIPAARQVHHRDQATFRRKDIQ